jgi:hypothetical protein
MFNPEPLNSSKESIRLIASQQLISTVPVAFSERNSFAPIPVKSVKLSRRGKGSKRRAQGAAQDSAPKHPRIDNTELSHNGLEAMGSNTKPAHHNSRDKRSGRRTQPGSSQTNYPQDGLANNTISTSIPTPTPQYGYGSGYSPYTATPPDYVANSNQYPTGNANGGSQMPFGSFDIPAWNPQAMNYDSTATSPSMPMPMPMMDPRLFASIMGNMQGQFPMMPFNNTASFQGVQAQPMSTMARPPGPIIHGQKPGPSAPRPRQRESTPPVDIPSATAEYMKQSSQKPTRCPTPRPLLIILDLNGTLVYRKHKKLPPSFASRAGLEHFLDVLTKKYAVMIWSSSQPATVEAICARIFSKEKKRNLVALWGRDRFGLTPVQYHAKLQVYKQLHKVWSSIEVQSSYPGNESYKPPRQNQNQFPANVKSKTKPVTREQKQQEQKQREQEMELAASFPPGQRWDQSNTILIDDSKLKALSEPFNILEIPEFTNNANLDESKLFSTVLARLDTLSRHDDVSKVLRGWNEMADLQKSSVLDLDIPPEDAEDAEEPLEVDDDDEEGGISLGEFSISTIPGAPPVWKNGQKKQKKGNANSNANANVNDATTVPKTQPPTDPEAIRLRKEAKKIRKKEKKVAKKAAEESARQETAAAAMATAPGETTTTGANTAPGTNTEYIGQRKRKAMKKARLEQEQDPLVQDPATIDPTAPRYIFRTRGAQVSAEAQAQALDGNENPIPIPTATTTPSFTGSLEGGADTTTAYTHGGRPEDRNRNRAPSPATSAASGNSLLDRLEDGLGFSK